MTLDRIEQKYWHRVMFANELIGAMANDGLLYMFDCCDFEEFLAKYPQDITKAGRKVWYFNESRDRECAELRGNKILINPMIVQYELGYPIIFEN